MMNDKNTKKDPQFVRNFDEGNYTETHSHDNDNASMKHGGMCC